MQSFTLLRTNPQLTTNVKVVYSDNVIYLESIDTNPQLNGTQYKRYVVPEDTNYPNMLANYWKETPSEIAFDNLDEEDFDIAYEEYSDQLDDIYFSGAKRILNTDYVEEFEYFAPIHFYKNDLPNDFIIFRVDTPGILNLTSTNFRESILENMKVVNRFNLKNNTKIGKFIHNTFNLEDIPTASLDIDFNSSEFTYWNGIDYTNGEFVSKGRIMDDIFENESSFTQGFETLTSGFEENGIIYPYIMNLSFLFDDIPANENNLRSWSINRYYGFYGNLESVGEMSPYRPPILKKGLKLDNQNIFTFNGEPVDPFMRGYKEDRTYYVEYLSEFYLISKVGDTSFKVISDIDLPKDVDDNYNKNSVEFGIDNLVTYTEGGNFVLDDDSDVLVIEIDGIYHRFIKNDAEEWKVLTDYKLTINNNIFKYFVNKSDPDFTTTLNLNNVTITNPPKVFRIYRFNFNDVKDFDTTMLDTKFSQFEFEFESEVTRSEEPKLYEEDSNFQGFEKPIEKFIYKKEVVSIPAANEYLTTNELFELIDKNSKPNKLWRKNFDIIKWGIEGSISNNDYPYMFNINQRADDYNRTTNVNELIPDRGSRNLDYFYTISSPEYNFGYNTDITYQSLSIINDSEFEMDKYFNSNYTTNYFDEIFGQSETYNGVTTNRNKISKFLSGDEDIPNKTLFKGIEVSIYDVDKIELNNNTVVNMNVVTNNEFENYDFSILLADINKDPDLDFEDTNRSSVWKIIKKWERNATYFPGDIVLFDGTQFKDSTGQYGFPGYSATASVGTISVDGTEYVYPNGETEELEIDENFNVTEIAATGPNLGISELFFCVATTSVSEPTETLDDDTSWLEYPLTGYNSIYYQKNRTYNAWNSSISHSFLIENFGVNLNYESYFTFYKGEYYISVANQGLDDNFTPEHTSISSSDGEEFQYWIKVEQYNITFNYTTNTIVTLNEDLYYYDVNTEELLLIHTFKPSAEIVYAIYDIVKFNDNYYTNLNNGAIFNNGINIYINKKWKNILIHIYINDLFEVYNINREVLYKAETQQLSASNIIEIVNTLTLKNGFMNNLKYYIINEDDTYESYDVNNISDLPHILQLQRPTEIEFYSHSLNSKPVRVNKEVFNINKKLENNNIDNLSQLNYYNNKPLAFNIMNLRNFTFEDETKMLYRYGGMYNPIFNSLELFNNIDSNRYTFNESLRGFGEIKEMIKSKVNEEGNLLKDKGDAYLSIYPQVDEIGYFVDNHNIFKSTWDRRYYKKTQR